MGSRQNVWYIFNNIDYMDSKIIAIEKIERYIFASPRLESIRRLWVLKICPNETYNFNEVLYMTISKTIVLVCLTLLINIEWIKVPLCRLQKTYFSSFKIILFYLEKNVYNFWFCA